MQKEERNEKILDILTENGFVKVTELSELLSVSEVTIRRDLQDLEDLDLLHRSHGGAKSINSISSEINYKTRRRQNYPEKNAIAKAAFSFIKENMVILLDAGSTNYAIALLIVESNFNNLTVITNDLHIAILFSESPKIKLITLGGNVIPEIGNMQGLLTLNALSTIYTDISFIGASCIHHDLKIYTPSEDKVILKQKLMEHTSTAICVVDESKFSNQGMYFVANIHDFDVFITNKKFSEKQFSTLSDYTQIITV